MTMEAVPLLPHFNPDGSDPRVHVLNTGQTMGQNFLRKYKRMQISVRVIETIMMWPTPILSSLGHWCRALWYCPGQEYPLMTSTPTIVLDTIVTIVT